MPAEDGFHRALIERADQQVHLLAVQAGGKGRLLGQRPGVDLDRLMVALVELEAADSLGEERGFVVIGENFAGFGGGEIGHEAAEHFVAAAPGEQRLVERRLGMREAVFPEVQLVAQPAGLTQEPVGIGIAPAPDERAGIGVRLPAGLQAEDVAGNVPLAELLQEAHDVLLVQLRRGAIPHAQAPHRRQAAAAGEEVVTLHGVTHVGTGEDVHVHAAGAGHVDAHEFRAQGLRAVQAVLARLQPAAAGGLRRDGRIQRRIEVAEVEAHVAGRIDVDAVAAGGDVKRRRAVRVAQDPGLVVADPHGPLAAQESERLQVHAQPIDLFPVGQGQLDGAAAGHGLELDARGREGQVPARRQRRQLGRPHRMLPEPQRRLGLRLAEMNPPHPGGHLVQRRLGPGHAGRSQSP